MHVELELGEHQLRALRSLLERPPARCASLSELAAAAVRDDRDRPVPAYRRRPRPPGPEPTPPGEGWSLDAALPAASARWFALPQGATMRIEQLKDGQCVDLYAVARTEPRRRFSAARTRAIAGLHPGAGTVLWSSAPEIPMLRIEADSRPGHDLGFPACSAFEYEQATGVGGHPACAELAAAALERAGLPRELEHDPLNLWLPSWVDAKGMMRSRPVSARRGDRVDLQALTDVVVVACACPDDLFGSSQYEPGPVRVMIRGASGERQDAAVPAPAWPASAVTVELADDLAGHLAGVRESGWLGFSDAQVLRALMLAYWERLLESESHARGGS